MFVITGCPKPSAYWGVKVAPSTSIDPNCIHNLLKNSSSGAEIKYDKREVNLLQVYHDFHFELTGAVSKTRLILGISIVEDKETVSQTSIVNGVPIDVYKYGKAQTKYMTFGFGTEVVAKLNETEKSESLSLANEAKKRIDELILKAQKSCGLSFTPEKKEISCRDFLCELNN